MLCLGRRACETPFEDSPDGLLQHLEIHVPAVKTTPHFQGDPGIEPLFDGFACCLRERDADKWYKAIDNRDIQVCTSLKEMVQFICCCALKPTEEESGS